MVISISTDAIQNLLGRIEQHRESRERVVEFRTRPRDTLNRIPKHGFHSKTGLEACKAQPSFCFQDATCEVFQIYARLEHERVVNRIAEVVGQLLCRGTGKGI